MNIKDLVFIILILILFIIVFNKKERMSNTDIKKLIQEEYKIDVEAVRNLSKLANDLTLNKKLVVPGGLEIIGKLTVKNDLNVLGSSTIKGNLNTGTIYSRGSLNAGTIHSRGSLNAGTIHSRGSLNAANIYSRGILKIKQTTLIDPGLGMLGIVTPRGRGKKSGGTIVIGSYNTWGRIWEYQYGRIILQSKHQFKGNTGGYWRQ